MNKNQKVSIVLFTATIMTAVWVAMLVTSTREQNINYWWGMALAVLSIVYGFIGLLTAKKWSWLKSGLGKAVFFISLGVIFWGAGQALWMYYVLKYPGQEIVESKLDDIIFLAAIPFWTYGIYKLSKATGLKYALKSLKAKTVALLAVIVLGGVSYYLLMQVARGGLNVDEGIWTATVNLLLTIGSAINLVLVAVIFGFSWKLLGGRFKNPIKTILISFGVMYLADFLFGYLSAKELYHNGDISDFLYFVAITTMCTALCLLDPTATKSKKIGQPIVDEQAAPVTQPPAQQPVAQLNPNPNIVDTNPQLNNINQEKS